MEHSHTIHRHQHHLGWDHAFAPVLRVAPGSSVEFEVLDAAGGQLSADSTVAAIAALDFGRINPVAGGVATDCTAATVSGEPPPRT